MCAQYNYNDESCIAAFATVMGNSALTLIRCSGKDSITLISSIFEPEKIKDAPGNTVIHGWIVGDELKSNTAAEKKRVKIDEVLVSVFRSPKSYTGEESLDICCHGGAAAGKAVMAALNAAGFRGALPGEFTFRAFMNGKIDLTRSESVMELVSAKTDASRRRAVMRLCGSLEKEINEIKESLVRVLASAEIYLDYSEDEISADQDEAAGKLPDKDTALAALARLKKLNASWQIERIYQEGVLAVIAGRPNAGKSSLFNMLLKEDRSIVTDVPGTTRDWIEANVSVKGIPVRLVDTAGLRETFDPVEKIGVERSCKLLEETDIILYLIDGERGLTDEDSKFITNRERCLLVWNKADIAPVPRLYPLADILPVSAKTGAGLDELYEAFVRAVLPRNGGKLDRQFFDEPSSASLGTVRQKNLVENACAFLEEALDMADKNEPLDLIAPLLREAVNSLGEITGEVSTADILEEMFSRFCVGK